MYGVGVLLQLLQLLQSQYLDCHSTLVSWSGHLLSTIFCNPLYTTHWYSYNSQLVTYNQNLSGSTRFKSVKIGFSQNTYMVNCYFPCFNKTQGNSSKKYYLDLLLSYVYIWCLSSIHWPLSKFPVELDILWCM